jgi:two-component system nitrogen regulation response regulator NtrX
MSPENMETELFGEESMTNGEQEPRKLGTFERAHNGTLLLDEVSDMPLETQGKIVRVLQEQVFQRVGGNTQVEVSVRVIATTTRNLSDELDGGRFREDLYYRLNVVPIIVPSLKERREDIPELTQHFMEQSAEASGQPYRTLSADAFTTLQAYDWPGNVRELRNIVERLLIMTPGDHNVPISIDMLPTEMTGITPASDTKFPAQAEIMGLPLRDAREKFEREYLVAQLERLDGNISRTAEYIGMERSALHRKLKSLGING